MNELEYTYAVARIRALESSLLTQSVIEQLIACQNETQCLQLLSEKGWGDPADAHDPVKMLQREEEKIWEVISDIAPDLSVFDVMSYTKVFHNVKAAIKAVCTGTEDRNVFYNDCSIPGAQMLAQEAYDVLLHTGDGQLCDVIVDRAALEAISEAGRNAEDAIIRDYAESVVAIADIKIAVRSQKTGKSQEFLKRALAPCDTVQVEFLAKAAANGMDAIRDYLLTTAYAGGAEALAESPSAFERWCDNRMIETMRPQKYQAFSVGPLVAYIVARENEIKTVRIILTGKQNQFPEEAIRERIREMYG